MSNITITIEAPELTAAINKLADALRGAPTASVYSPQTSEAPAVAGTTITNVSAPAYTPTTPAQTPAAPAAPAQTPAAPAVPTATPTYTLEQLANAATPLIDAGRSAELSALLASFGVQALTQLPKEQYGAFATALRGMGAKI